MIGLPRVEGTRFRIYPQPSFLDGFHEPVTVVLPVPPGRIAPGPQDERMYAVLPVGKAEPYGIETNRLGRPVAYLPPWRGPRLPPAMPDPDGHFDHLEPGTPQFVAAHAFACARLVLAVWERYCGPIAWHFEATQPRLEVIHTGRAYDSAQCGAGFLELGVNPPTRGRVHPFALNFDVIAHEMGHLIVFALLGLPRPSPDEGQFRGFHEAMADMVSLIALLHLDTVVDSVLRRTRGNLYLTNELNRFAEVSASEEIRAVSNGVKLGEFADGWADEHDLSLPLSGALFDILVEVHQLLLVGRGVLDPRVLDYADNVERSAAFRHPLEDLYEAAWTAAAPEIKRALRDARDLLASYLVALWRRLDPNDVTYAGVGRTLLAIDADTTGGQFAGTITRSFAWREIWTTRVGPLLTVLPRNSHLSSVRTVAPTGIPGATTGCCPAGSLVLP